MSKQEHLFVYGLLRPESGHDVAGGLMARARHIGQAEFQGRLYDNGGYPGVVDSDDSADCVIGDVFEIPGDPAFIERLDAFEGCAPSDAEPHEYRRALRTVKLGADRIACWIYLYNWSIDDKKRIENSDFLAAIAAEFRKQVVR